MIIGPSINAVRDRAKAQVIEHFVTEAERDGTPPTLRALYVMKAAQAEIVLAGGTSAMIEGEAELRGYTPWEMANIIAYMAAESVDMELARMRANVAIEAAKSEHEIVTILDTVGVKFRMDLE